MSLAGRIYAVPASSPGVCGYSLGEVGSIMAGAGLGGGDYLSVMCGNGNLPTDLQSVCLPGADWEAVIIASTDAPLATECPSECAGGGGCMAGTAEGVE